MRNLKFVLVGVAVLLLWQAVEASRLKDIANIRGVRENQLVGYGLVVGLNGTGDGKSEFTSKSMTRMLDAMGMKLSSGDVSSKNVAAVLVTAKLPPFARSGNKIDVTVHSIGDASSLVGGTLIQTPLRAANQQVFAVAQGGILVGAQAGGAKAHQTVGRVPNGAIIERDLESDFASRKTFRLTLHMPDFTTAARVVKIVNKDLGGKYAVAKDSSTIDIVVPFTYEGNAVELLASIENLEVEPDNRARVVVNEKTGTVVIGSRVKISRVAISHGSISVKVKGRTKDKNKNDKEGKVALVGGDVKVGELVRALNDLGVSPKDLITILQNIKAAGALHAELEIL
jgi:flagellar P-ring protein precursor FlgI